MIPNFDHRGRLPAGVHTGTWTDFSARFGWTRRREWLLEGLLLALRQLKASGCRSVYIDGSFVTRKAEPDDYDGCWDTAGVNTALLDPILLDFSQGRLKQKIKYRGELFPAQFKEGVSGLTFLSFFQIAKEDGEPKGIIFIDLGTVL